MAGKKRRIKDSPIDPHKEGMAPEEMRNYDVLRESKKRWTPGEAREMATNPMGALGPPSGKRDFIRQSKGMSDFDRLKAQVKKQRVEGGPPKEGYYKR